MAKYRKRLGRYEPWHFFPGCPDWPVYGYIEQDEIPQEELCHKCIDASAESDPEATRAPRTRLARVPPVRVLFRKERHGDTWHTFPTCLMWPRRDYVERAELPSVGALCNECRVRLFQGN